MRLQTGRQSQRPQMLTALIPIYSAEEDFLQTRTVLKSFLLIQDFMNISVQMYRKLLNERILNGIDRRLSRNLFSMR